MTELCTFEYAHDGQALKGEIARPPGPGPHPAVLVMHHAIGLGENELRRTRMLAEAGYVALATDMYGIGAQAVGRDVFTPLFAGLQADPSRLRGRVLAGYEALRALPEVDGARIGAIGFCFGGQCVLELARTGAQVASVVSFHGLLTTDAPARKGGVQAKVLAIAGALDPYAPPEHVAEFQKEMASAEVDWHLTVYGQGLHAFTDPSVAAHDIPGVRYDAMLDHLSWAQATAFLEATLRPS
jgi:dienelactone hydrolase